MTRFDDAFDLVVMRFEGGSRIMDDPNDPGGLTKYGISKRAHPEVDIANLDAGAAKYIYRTEYWDKCRCDEIRQPLDLYLFDAAVNQGPHTAVSLLQSALMVNVDGVVGPVTIGAAKSATDWHIARFLAYRAERYRRLPHFERYANGWLTRLFMLAMAG